MKPWLPLCQSMVLLLNEGSHISFLSVHTNQTTSVGLSENLNYSEKALNAVFGRYFGTGGTKRNAAEYARNPEKIANYVYQDEFRKYKMGNVNPGDGWMFRGRGLKQLTGRENYTRFGKSCRHGC